MNMSLLVLKFLLNIVNFQDLKNWNAYLSPPVLTSAMSLEQSQACFNINSSIYIIIIIIIIIM